MKEIGILYSTPMILAKLAGRKTLTRRPVKIKHLANNEIGSIHPDGAGTGWVAWSPRPVSAEETKRCYPGADGFRCPYGQPGDILYAKESWCLMNLEENPAHPPKFYYKANGEDIRVVDGDGYQVYNKNGTAKSPWKSSRFMPKVASRIWERVISVRPERLGDITEEDAIREGVEYFDDHGSRWFKDYIADASGYGHPDFDFPTTSSAVKSFISLWQSIHGPESWNPDTWVWRLETEVLSTTGRPANI